MASRTTAACSIPPPIAACWMRSADMEALLRETSRALCRLGTRRAQALADLKARAAAAADECRFRARRGQGIVALSSRRRARKSSLAGERALMMNAVAHRRGCDRGGRAAVAASAAPEASLAPALKKLSRMSEEARKRGGRRRSRAGTGLCADRGSAARTGCAAVAARHRHRGAGTQGRAAVRAARRWPANTACTPDGLAARAGGFPGASRTRWTAAAAR